MLIIFILGVESEGLYRVAGFHDDVEAIKMSFDKGKRKCDILRDSMTSTITVQAEEISF